MTFRLKLYFKMDRNKDRKKKERKTIKVNYEKTV